MTAVPTFPAGSVAVRAMPFVPELIGTSTEKVPSPPAVAVAAVPFASLRATTVDRPCVFPVMVTVSPFTVAPSSGALTVTFGLLMSSTNVINDELSLSPPGPTSVAVTLLRPFSRGSSSTTKEGVSPTATSRTATGSWSGRAT